MKRIISLLLVLTLLLLSVTVLVGCDKENAPVQNSTPIPTEEIKAARDKLSAKPYRAVATVRLSSEDAAFNEELGAFGEEVISMLFDGEKFSISMSAKVGEVTVNKSYFMIDETIYLDRSIHTGEVFLKELKKAEFAAQDKAMLISRLGIGANIDEGDFNTLSAILEGEVCTVTATDVKSDSLYGIIGVFSESLGLSGGDLTVTGASYALTLSGGSIVKTELLLNMRAVTGGSVKQLSATVTTEYDYDYFVIISLPESEDRYEAVSFDELLG